MIRRSINSTTTQLVRSRVVYNINNNNNNNKYNNTNSIKYYTTNSYNNNNNDNNKKNTHDNGYKYFGTTMTAALVIGACGYTLCECFEDHENHVVQIKTGYKYPKYLIGNDEYRLVVVGTRALTMFKFNVYSIGMYINESEAKKQLLEHSKKDQIDFCNGKAVVLEQLMSNGTGLCIKIKPTRKVTWDHIFNGFEGTMADMMWRKYQMDLGDVEILMKQLKSAFPGNMDMPTTSEIDFLRKDADTLVVLFDNKPVKEITDQRFATTFFEFYLGDRSKVPVVRKEFYERLWKILQPADTEHLNRFGLH
ncbi:hypothetical protein DFA_04770 [Cavenderia fasciculata]|uniref:Chalcone isomerase domain-containing protein n=1 Tax=Cavenderia fasciculata TaxID=261658 RepID=F4PQH7_CACFS|nr:uncharacterized protein DFA_04770 [Cavenderia fasciculata]EGG22640.1 hypothetical protein DFA_04770 [Cavenderia fasciculata]|eukprot:XP_004360491.1 hypothetical protein DFA_04770 [Cavenderia fasciculata]